MSRIHSTCGLKFANCRMKIPAVSTARVRNTRRGEDMRQSKGWEEVEESSLKMVLRFLPPFLRSVTSRVNGLSEEMLQTRHIEPNSEGDGKGARERREQRRGRNASISEINQCE
eukprot:3934776-Rhodomonas_salina.3